CPVRQELWQAGRTRRHQRFPPCWARARESCTALALPLPFSAARFVRPGGWNGDGAIVYHEPAERSSPGENAPHEIPHTVEDDRNSARPARTAESPSRPCQEPALGVACPHTLAVRAPGPVPLGGDTPQSRPHAVGAGPAAAGCVCGGQGIPEGDEHGGGRSGGLPSRREYVVPSRASAVDVA